MKGRIVVSPKHLDNFALDFRVDFSTVDHQMSERRYYAGEHNVDRGHKFGRVLLMEIGNYKYRCSLGQNYRRQSIIDIN